MYKIISIHKNKPIEIELSTEFKRIAPKFSLYLTFAMRQINSGKTLTEDPLYFKLYLSLKLIQSHYKKVCSNSPELKKQIGHFVSSDVVTDILKKTPNNAAIIKQCLNNATKETTVEQVGVESLTVTGLLRFPGIYTDMIEDMAANPTRAKSLIEVKGIGYFMQYTFQVPEIRYLFPESSILPVDIKRLPKIEMPSKLYKNEAHEGFFKLNPEIDRGQMTQLLSRLAANIKKHGEDLMKTAKKATILRKDEEICQPDRKRQYIIATLSLIYTFKNYINEKESCLDKTMSYMKDIMDSLCEDGRLYLDFTTFSAFLYILREHGKGLSTEDSIDEFLNKRFGPIKLKYLHTPFSPDSNSSDIRYRKNRREGGGSNTVPIICIQKLS